MKKRLKVNGIIIAFSVALIAFFPGVFFRMNAGGGWEEYVELAGFAFILLGQLIRVSARGYKAEHSFESQALVQEGPYRLVRNPMYFGIFLIGLGVVLAVFKWWAAAVFMAIFVIRYITLIYKEERRLAIVFPRSYKDYCKKVPRILPSLPAMMEMDISEYLPVRLSWFKKEIGAILVVLFLTLLVESWEEVVRGGFWGYVRQSSWLFLVFILFMAFIVLLSKWTDKNYGNGTVKG